MGTENTVRDYYFDNAKFILILLMVLGHFTFENREHPMMIAMCNTIYSFHMPLFIFISGYFSKTIFSHRKSDVTHILIPYLMLEFIHYLYTSITGFGYGHIQFVFPTYQNWYMLSLFIWRMLVPYFSFFKKPIGITVMVVIALGAGFVNQLGEFLTLYRCIFLMPFFVFGYYASDVKSWLIKFKSLRVVFVSLFIMLAGLLFWISFTSNATAEKIMIAFIPNRGYANSMDNFILRACALPFASIMAFLFMFIIPERKTFFTKFGKNTLTVFMFHMFILWPLNTLFIPYKPFITELICIGSSLLITVLLSLDITSKIMKPFSNPYTTFKTLVKGT